MKHLCSSLLFVLALLLAACIHTPDTPSLAVSHQQGWPLPALSAADQNGNNYSLTQAGSSEWTIVFFYPEADTPG